MTDEKWHATSFNQRRAAVYKQKGKSKKVKGKSKQFSVFSFELKSENSKLFAGCCLLEGKKKYAEFSKPCRKLILASGLEKR